MHVAIMPIPPVQTQQQARSQDLKKGGVLFWIRITRFIRKLRRNFSENSEIQTLFQPKTRWSPKKRSSPKLRRFFRPKSEIQTLFQAESRHLLHNFGTQFPLGAVFIFSPKIGLKSTKNVRFCILYRPMEGLESPPPPWLRYCPISCK